MSATHPRWWQWPTVLSLDAPAVLLAWQDLAARAAGIELRFTERFVLGASVWMAYSADRWIEGCRLEPGTAVTARHAFSQRARWPLACAWVAILAATVFVAQRGLSAAQFRAGLWLLPAVAAYLFSHQHFHREVRWRLPKELCVAAILTLGIYVLLAPRVPPGPRGRLELPLALFGLLAFANCALISAWERDVDAAQDQTSLALQFRRGHWLGVGAAATALVAGAACCAFVPAFRLGGGATVLAGALLLLVDRAECRLGWAIARVLVDAALLTPLLVRLVRR